MHRRTPVGIVLALVGFAGLGLGGAAPAAADDDPDVTPGGGGLVATDTDTGVILGTEPPAGSTGTGPPATYELDLVHGVSPEGDDYQHTDACWGIVLADGDNGMTWAEVTQQQQSFDDPHLYGACPVEDTFDLVAFIEQAWQSEVQPPPPSPLQVAPGKALTGLTAYLEIGGDPNPVTTLPNPIGPDVVITMTPRYVISWGDGASTDTTSQGGPYPSGDLTHVYTEAEPVVVTVQAYWTATWSAGGAGDELPELAEPTEASLDLPVEERQVVID